MGCEGLGIGACGAVQQEEPLAQHQISTPVLFTPSVVRVKALAATSQGWASIQLALGWKSGALLVPASCCLACSARRHCVSVFCPKQIMDLIMFWCKGCIFWMQHGKGGICQQLCPLQGLQLPNNIPGTGEWALVGKAQG